MENNKKKRTIKTAKVIISTFDGICLDAYHFYGKLIIGEERIDVDYELNEFQADKLNEKERLGQYKEGERSERFFSFEHVLAHTIALLHHLNEKNKAYDINKLTVESRNLIFDLDLKPAIAFWGDMENNKKKHNEGQEQQDKVISIEKFKEKKEQKEKQKIYEKIIERSKRIKW